MAIKLFPAIRIVAIPILIALIVVLETRHFFSLFRLATFFLAFLLLSDIASLLRGGWRNSFVVLASLAFGLFVGEAAANALEPKVSVEMTRGWSVRQPEIGWGPEHAGRFHARKSDPKTGAIIYEADYTIDSRLLRQTLSGDNEPTIVFFGDSYTFGDGVNDDETLPQIFSDSLQRKQRVLNLAFTGYGPQQFLRELEIGRFQDVIGPKPRLFIFMTAPWHAERTACKAYWTPHAPLYAIENDKVVYKGACNEGLSLWWREWLENTSLYRMLIEPYRHKIDHDDVELYIRTLLAAVSLAKEKYGVDTLIPYLRVPQEYLPAGFTNDGIMKRFRDGGAIVIDASLLKEESAGATISIPGDGHPTPFANRARAALLKDYLAQHMSGVLLSGLE